MSTPKRQYSPVREKLVKIVGTLQKDLAQFVLNNAFIAGGAVRDLSRNNKPKDFDVFFKTEEAKEEFIKKWGQNCDVTGIGNYNLGQFQFITIYTGSPEEIIKKFDWNVNQVYVDFAGNEKIENWEKYLRLNLDSEKPLSALLRLPFMLEKGFEIDQRDLLYALTFLYCQVPMTSMVEVARQHEWMSSGGGMSGVDPKWTIESAKEEASKRSKLAKIIN